jgi:hypothetical protein
LSTRSNLTHPALLLEAPAKDVVDADSCVWLAWLVWAGPALRLVFAEHTGEATVHTSTAADVLRTDWLAGDIEQLMTDQST